jgi:hypothetical protein
MRCSLRVSLWESEVHLDLEALIKCPTMNTRTLHSFRVGWLDTDYPRRQPPYRARGWEVHLEPQDRSLRFHPATEMVLTGSDGSLITIPALEVILKARSLACAQQAADLMNAAHSVFDGGVIKEELIAYPKNAIGRTGITSADYISAPTLADGAAMAAKATRKARWANSIARLFVSYRISSRHGMDFEPSGGVRFFVTGNPLAHAHYAQAVVAAYSAIETLGAEIRASQNNPSKIGGVWNPRVLSELERRLEGLSISPTETLGWLIRETATRIERRHGVPAGSKAKWARHRVRDRLVRVTDGIDRASLLRSKASAHGSSRLTRSLTAVDVENVQSLARFLILSSMGFLP